MFGLAALLGCAPNGESEPDERTDEEPDEEFVVPEFLDAASGEVMLRVDRTDDLEFNVRGVRPGLTGVFIDEQSIGIASDDTGLATLTADTLTVRLEGAMLVGDHTIKLQTLAPDKILESEVVTLFVGNSTVTGLSATMNDAVAFQADSIDAHGHGDSGVLMGLDLESETVMLTLAPSEGDGWAFGDAVTLELPDFDRTDEPRFTVSAGIREVDDERRVRIAWRSGLEGRAMLGSDILWPPPSIQVQTVVDLTAELDGFEYTRLGRPLILGDVLVMEALLTQDVERPTPGDRTLLTSVIDPTDARFGPARVSAVGGGRDIDRIAPVRDVLTHLRGGTPGFAARAAGVRGVSYDIDTSTGTLSERPSGSNDRFSALRDINGPPQTILGSLQARHVFAPLEADTPRVFLRQFDDRPRGGSEDASPGPNALEALSDISAPVTSTVIAGVPVFLIPQGIDTPVAAIYSGGPTPRVVLLDGLACEEVAVPITPDAADSGMVSVACRRGRDVHRGTIRVDEET